MMTPLENYYIEIFQPSRHGVMFEKPIDLNDAENRKIFFKEITPLIAQFRTKINIDDHKTALEISYTYLIPFILFKSLVDHRFGRFENEYTRFKQQIVQAIREKDLYHLVVFPFKNTSEFVSQNIYRPFAEKLQAINDMLIAGLQREPTIQDIAPWLDIVAFMDRFDFSNLQHEIFGFVYENYLKDLYGGKNKGQFFTDPAVVDFMLDELGYTPKELAKDTTKISIIDPACGAGTFLYSAVNRIIESFEGTGTVGEAIALDLQSPLPLWGRVRVGADGTLENVHCPHPSPLPEGEGTRKSDFAVRVEAIVLKELVDENVFGLDTAEFPLFLAEMGILLHQLPLIVNDLQSPLPLWGRVRVGAGRTLENAHRPHPSPLPEGEGTMVNPLSEGEGTRKHDFADRVPLIVNDLDNAPVEKKLKLFKTRDSISEFLDTGMTAHETSADSFSHVSATMDKRQRFDFVIGNPPYIGYNECAKQGFEFVKRIQDKKDASITMGNVFGVNLHTVPGMPKPYAPKPNLYAFFIALGLALLKENGKLCFVIPQTLLTAGDMDVMRYHLAKHTSIDKMITFGGNLFIDRGVDARKPIRTSSLIIIVTKKEPKTNHRVKVVNFVDNTKEKKVSLQTLLNSRKKMVSSIPQSELAKTVENWNFIKYDKTVLQWLKKYNELNLSIEEYRRNSLSDYNEMQFDKGLVFDKKKISTDFSDWLLPHKMKNCFRIGTKNDSIATKYIRIPQGSQGLKIFDNKYKIIWRYMNPDRFYYSDERIMIDFNWVIISSENKLETLFLFSVLNSKLSHYILGLYLKNAHEKAFQVGIKSIKKYIRIPLITAGNRKMKDKIIALTESMLALESVMPCDIDFDERDAIKRVIDDLVFALYFDIPVKDVAKHEFYDYVSRSTG